MSIILKGIDPKTDYGLCILTIKGELITANGKHIQAIQIPKGHGRLIDGDKIMNDLEEWKQNPNNDDEAVVFVNHFQGVIRTEPTILEAEE